MRARETSIAVMMGGREERTSGGQVPAAGHPYGVSKRKSTIRERVMGYTTRSVDRQPNLRGPST